MPLTEEQEKYLNQRGFEAFDRRSTLSYPCLVLGPRTRLLSRGEVEFHTAEGVYEFNTEVLHPSQKRPRDELVDAVIGVVTTAMDKKRTPFTTQPGTAIPVIVEDRAWTHIALRLEQRFR